MDRLDRADYVERYERRLREHGHSPEALDVGCGFADLFDHLVRQGWDGEYHGIDIVPGLLAEARRRHPALDLQEADIRAYEPPQGAFDVVVGSGVFNARLKSEDNRSHITRSVERMFALSRRALCVDFLSTYVDFQRPEGWHTDPAWALELGRGLSKRLRLRHDYMPFEFALIVYRDDEHPGNVFRPHHEGGSGS